MSQKTKKQHYVPQCYLNAWGIAGRHQIHIYDKALDKTRINNIEDVASERFFYDVNPNEIFSESTLANLKEQGLTWDSEEKSQGIEHVFAAEVEKPFSDLLREMITKASDATPWHIKNCFFVSQEKKGEFAAYLALQYIRTKRVRMTFHETSDCIIQAAKEFGFQESSCEKYSISDEQAKNIHVQMLMDIEVLCDLTKSFIDKTWILGINRTKTLFYTSDSPIATHAHIKHSFMSMSGIGSKGVEVVFPISPSLILIMIDGSYHTQCLPYERRYIEITENDQVEFYNSVLAFQANRTVFSTDGDFNLLEDMKRKDPGVFKRPALSVRVGDKTIYPKND